MVRGVMGSQLYKLHSLSDKIYCRRQHRRRYHMVYRSNRIPQPE